MTPCSLDDLAQLITAGQESAKERFAELKRDFEAKHQENQKRRHELRDDLQTVRDEVYERCNKLADRVMRLETTNSSIVGSDNSGASGLLHELNRKVDALRKLVFMALGICVFLAFVVPVIVTVVLFMLKH